MGFAQIYVCPKHGETIHPVETEFIDCENDDIEFYLLCPQPGCIREVKLLTPGGKPILRPLTEEEMFWETYDPESDDEFQY